MNNTYSVTNLATLQGRKAELEIICKQKELEIGNQIDYIGEHIGSIALQSLTGYKVNQGGNTKGEIIQLLISEGIDTALVIQADPTNLKEKIVAFIKKVAGGIVQILTR
jgi:hypothetical protein